jgi:VanZ family protein
MAIFQKTLRLVRNWWPALVWAGIIFTLSTDSFSSKQTYWIFSHILRWLDPAITMHQIHLLNEGLRKAAHVTEYGIFYFLLFRSLRGSHKGWGWTWAFTALAVAAGYSALDEFHQTFVPSRGPSPWDSLLDTSAAALVCAVLWLWYRVKRPAVENSFSEEKHA